MRSNKPSAFKRFVHWALLPALWYWRLRWRYRISLVLVLAIGAGLPLALAWRRERQNRRDQWIAYERARFDRAVSISDVAIAESALAHLAELLPTDRAVAARLAALRRGESEAGDAALARLLLNEHLQHDRWDEAARAANIRLAAAPNDLLARVVLAEHARRLGRRDEAMAHVDALPAPDDALDSATPGALLLAVRLRRDFGRDDRDLVEFLAERVLPILKSRGVENLKPIGKIQLIQCYHEACRDLAHNASLAELWVPAARLLGEIGDQPGRAKQAALLHEEHLAVLDRLRLLNKVSETDAGVLRAELEQRVDVLWQRLRAEEPESVLADLGLALVSYRKGDVTEAVRRLVAGLERGGDTKDLYVTLARLLRQSDPTAGLAFLERAAKRFPNDPALLQLLAELAVMAGRPDRALEACRQARKSRTDLAWACRLEAGLCLANGRPTQAIEALAPLRSALAQDAAAAELYVRALCAIGADEEANALWDRFPNTGGVEGRTGAARGFLLAGRIEYAKNWAERIVELAPEHVPARQVHAEALRLDAEAGDAVKWESEKVRHAIQAYDWLRRRAPDDRMVAVRVVRLQLYGLKAPELAQQAARPLQAESDWARLTPEMLEVLGELALVAGDLNRAREYLDAAVLAAPAAAGPYIIRCQLLIKLNRPGEARADLDRAAALPRSPRQAAQWQRAADQLRGIR